MKQNSLNIFKISSIVFVLAFVTALIFFFIPKVGNLSNVSYQDALKQAKEKNLPILVTSYSKWDKKQKLSNQILFTDTKLLEQINKSLITVILDADNEKEMKKIEELGLTSGFGLISDKNGKPITFIPNSTSSTEFSIFLKEALNIPFFKWENLENAIIQSKQNNKNIIVFSTTYINDNLLIAELLKNPMNLQYVEINFNPILLYLKHKPDFEQGRQILGFDDPMIKEVEGYINLKAGVDNSNGSTFSMLRSGKIKLSILSPDKKVIAQGNFDDELISSQNMQKFIEKILLQENNKRVE